MNTTISLVMIVKNEEANLPRCLESVQGIVDEIVIVDTGSEDNTKEIAKQFGAKVYDFEWCNDFSAARNYALSKATGDWNLVLDADEYIISGTKSDLVNGLKKGTVGQILLIDVFKDKMNKEEELSYSKIYLSRIMSKGTKYIGKIHEQIDSKLPRVKVNLEVGHDGYLHKDKSERNLAILYDVIKKDEKNSYMLYQLAHTLFVAGKNEQAMMWYEKYYKVSKLNEGYRCSAIVDYLYSMIQIGKLEKGITIIEKEKANYYDSPDFNFVCATFYRELVLSNVEKYINYLPLIESYYINCLEIGETTKYTSVVGTGSYAAAYNLGVWYEVSKQFDKAKVCYEMAIEWGYEKAAERIKLLK
ncbi:glycosyltransferase family 2 protein [Cellulosilyticum ruminicola]|uniref:glycosyltransferase family 2 protein n=1 Tax=Cellulosilyticum ruminicola TaxID=425254 RepID=UPI0006CFC598|nr:glycosyltransferase family 2 protein [Cellulosilyticum ruminicola]